MPAASECEQPAESALPTSAPPTRATACRSTGSGVLHPRRGRVINGARRLAVSGNGTAWGLVALVTLPPPGGRQGGGDGMERLGAQDLASVAGDDAGWPWDIGTPDHIAVVALPIDRGYVTGAVVPSAPTPRPIPGVRPVPPAPALPHQRPATLAGGRPARAALGSVAVPPVAVRRASRRGGLPPAPRPGAACHRSRTRSAGGGNAGPCRGE